jgi:hypothetical protein
LVASAKRGNKEKERKGWEERASGHYELWQVFTSADECDVEDRQMSKSFQRTMNPNIPTRLQPPDQILQTLTRHRLPRLTRLCVVGVKEVRGLIRLETGLFGLFAVDLAAVLADVEDLCKGEEVSRGGKRRRKWDEP